MNSGQRLLLKWVLLSAAVIPLTASTIFFLLKKMKKNKLKKPRKFYTVQQDGQSRASLDSESFTPTPAKSWSDLGIDKPVVIAMVGLPARGKSYITKMVIRYLNWTGFEAEVFNVGSFRRQLGMAGADSNFFDNSNKEGAQIREKMAMDVQEFMYKWLHERQVEGK